jgi:hypothetical protein
MRGATTALAPKATTSKVYCSIIVDLLEKGSPYFQLVATKIKAHLLSTRLL